ncbi:MAG: FtsX-like permease family protein, partial [Bacteroidota bacterium]
VINQEFARKMGWDDPLGKQIRFDEQLVTVIGIVGNMRHAFFSADDVRPMIFTSSSEAAYDYLTVKYDPGALVAVDAFLEDHFHTLAPYEPYERSYQSQLFDRWYDNVDSNIALMSAIGLIAIFLTCLGLYGLISYRLQIRLKEFAIRKTMGAGSRSLVRVVFREYRWILIIAIGIGVPLGTWGIHGTVLELFSVSKPFSLLPVLLAVGITLTAFVVTIAQELRGAISINPADILRDD